MNHTIYILSDKPVWITKLKAMGGIVAESKSRKWPFTSAWWLPVRAVRGRTLEFVHARLYGCDDSRPEDRRNVLTALSRVKRYVFLFIEHVSH
jgi:hypothetical protein